MRRDEWCIREWSTPGGTWMGFCACLQGQGRLTSGGKGDSSAVVVVVIIITIIIIINS